MPRIRTIKPEFWEDERIGQLSVEARLLYLGMISHADDAGRLRASIPLLKAQVFPYDQKVDVARARRALVEASRVVVYSSDGDTFAWIPKFTSHQKIDRPSPSKLPDPEASTSIRRGLDEGSTTDQEGIKEGIKEGNGSSVSPVARAPPAPPEPKPAEVVYGSWCKELGKDPTHPMGDAWGIIGARLKEGFTVEQLCQVAVGARLDAERWPERKAQNEIRFLFGTAGQCRKFIDLAKNGNPQPKRDLTHGHQTEGDWDRWEAEKKAKAQ